MSGRKSQVHGVLVTFRRPVELGDTLDRLSSQTRKLDSLLVVDNDADDEVRRVVQEKTDVAHQVDYMASEGNIGPAGALAIGVGHILTDADDSDWVMFFDDDNPPKSDDRLAQITGFAEELAAEELRLGGVGLVGARFDLASGRLRRIADDDLSGSIRVDYVGGGQLPCYRVAALRAVGSPEAELFFGFDDLEYGLRIGEAGWNLFVDGEALLESRRVSGRIGIDKSPSRNIGAAGWRTYYSTRNLLWILRQRRRYLAALRVIARTVGKGVYNLPRSPKSSWRYLRLVLRGVSDGLRGKLGRTIDPTAFATTVDEPLPDR